MEFAQKQRKKNKDKVHGVDHMRCAEMAQSVFVSSVCISCDSVHQVSACTQGRHYLG